MARCYTLSAVEAQRLEEDESWAFWNQYLDLVTWALAGNHCEPIVVEAPDHRIVMSLRAD
jgi:hypothetical protein